MFVNDLMASTIGNNLSNLKNWLTQLIIRITELNNNHNIKLSNKKGKCSIILFTNKRTTQLPKVYMNNKALESVKNAKLLDIILDSKLIIIDHYKVIKNEISRRIHQLQSVANCYFGPM